LEYPIHSLITSIQLASIRLYMNAKGLKHVKVIIRYIITPILYYKVPYL